MNVELTEEERQGILLAIAHLAVERPGWHRGFLSPIADKLCGRDMYEEFRRMKELERSKPP